MTTMKPKKTWTPKEREMLFRRAYGKIGLASYLEILSAFLATPVQTAHILDLEETDNTIKRERTVLQEKKWISSNRADVMRWYKGREYMTERQILLFAQSLINQKTCHLYWPTSSDDCGNSHCCGAYRTDTDTQINLDFDFAKHAHDCDDIYLYAADGSFRLHLDYHDDELVFDLAGDSISYVMLLECTHTVYDTGT